jgi:hypothetical protein
LGTVKNGKNQHLTAVWEYLVNDDVGKTHDNPFECLGVGTFMPDAGVAPQTLGCRTDTSDDRLGS